MPLIKTTGNLTTEAIIFIVAGILVGGIENIIPRAAKQTAARIIANARIIGFDIVIPRTRPIITGTTDMTAPKAKEAIMSPMTMVSGFTGQDISRSNVLAIASHGMTIGEIEVAVKNRIIPKSPGIIKSTVTCLPMVKDRNRKMGKRSPKIITGPLE
jgi:hypothetical protein